MAEFILKDLLKKNNMDNVYVESRATCFDETGNDMYYLAKEKLDEEGISYTKREASILTKEDYNKYDLIIGMDENNIRNIIKIIGIDKDDKVYKLNYFCGNNNDIADPWYTRDFDTAYEDIYRGTIKLLEYIKKTEK
jgi:protein-tyrosine phosphatase